MVRAKPERRMWLLEGLRLDRDVLERPEVAGRVHARLGPEAPHQADSLGESRCAPLRRKPDHRVSARVPAQADADNEPPLAQVIERGEALREVDGAPKRGQ